MRLNRVVLFGILITASLLWSAHRAHAADRQSRVVRLAELEVDPAQLDRYKAALEFEISASIRLEPGVLTLYAVSIKDHPEQIRLVEIYASPAAYQAHLQTPHFKKYKAETQGMVRSLRLLETEPILLGSK